VLEDSIFWDVVLCHLGVTDVSVPPNSCLILKGESAITPRNLGNRLPRDTGPHSTRIKSYNTDQMVY